MTTSRFDVFLSHNSQDKPAVLAIAHALQEAGLAPWLDKWYLRGGDPWQHVLRNALDASTACAFFFGGHGAGDWHELELQVAQDRNLKDANFRLIPVLLPGLPEPFEPTSMPLFLSTLMWVDLRQGVEDPARLQELIEAITGMRSPNGRVVEPEVSDVSPYRGLHTFDKEHAEFFFGREADIQRVLEKLKASRFLAVVGPSGSGKSSLVRAGLLPALERNGLPGSERWQVRVIKPGSQPLETLAAHLAQLGNPGAMQQTIAQFQDSERTLHLATTLALLDHPDDVRLVWVVDQAEEVFTLCQDEAERAAFLANLLYAASVPDGRCTVVLTLRADFYPRLATYPKLAQRLGTDQYLVSPLEGQGLRDAIEKPAARVGVVFEPGLVETIIEDVRSQPGAQPLLEHALLELWQRRRGRTLTLGAYQEIGGVSGALAKRADESFTTLDPEQQAIARRAMLRLTQPGEGTEDTRRRAELNELARRPEERDAVQHVVDALVAARLLTTGGDGQTGARWVDVAHEALIRGWPRLRGWLEEDRKDLVAHHRLTDAADDWEHGGRDPDLLFRGTRLAEARDLAERHADAFNELERQFLAESEALRARQRAIAEAERTSRERRRQHTIAALAAGLVAALALSGLAGWQWWNAGQQTAIAEQQTTAAGDARSTAVAEAARAENETIAARDAEARAENETEAARAAEEEARTQTELAETAEVRAENEARVALSRQLAAQSRAHSNEPDLGLLLAAEAYDLNPGDPEIRRTVLSSLQAQAHLQSVVHAQQGGINTLAFNPDGTTLASAGKDGTIRLWDMTTSDVAESVVIRHGDRGAVAGAEFSPDGQQLASLNWDDASIRLWDPITGAAKGPVIAFGDRLPAQMEFSPQGDVIASGTADGSIEFWNLATGERIGGVLSGHEGEVGSLSFSPDGALLMSSGYEDGAIRFWDVETGTADGDPIELGQTWVGAAFSPDGRTFLVAAGLGEPLSLWDAANRSPIGELVNAPAAADVSSINFSQDGAILYAGVKDGSLYRWNTLTRQPIGVPIETGLSGITGLTVAPDGATLAFAGSGDAFYLLHTAFDKRPLLDDMIGGDAPWGIAVNSDGSMIATGDVFGEINLWNTADGSRIGSPLRGHAKGITSLRFSDDGTLLASASFDGTARLWQVAGDPRPLFAFSGHDLPNNAFTLHDVAFSPNGNLLATAGGDSMVRLWDVIDGSAVGDPFEMPTSVWTLSFDPQGTTLVAADANGTIAFWDIASGEAVGAPIESGQGGVNAVRFVDHGAALASAGNDGTIRYWDTRDRRRTTIGSQETSTGSLAGRIAMAHTGSVLKLDTNTDGTLIATSGVDGRVLLWKSGELTPFVELVGPDENENLTDVVAFSGDGSRLVFTEHDESGFEGSRANVWDVGRNTRSNAFVVSTLPSLPRLSRDGSSAIAGDWDGRTIVWDTATGSTIADQWTPDPANITTSAMSTAGSVVAVGDISGSVHLWNFETSEPIGPPIAGHGDWVNTVAFSPDGALLASGARDGVVWVRDITRASPVGSSFIYKNSITGEPTLVWPMAFNNDGSLLAVTSWRDIVLWDVLARQFAGPPLKGHQADVNAITFSPDGRLLASGGTEGAVFLWDMSTRTVARRLIGGALDEITALAFSRDGSLLAVGGETGSLEIWDLSGGSAYLLGDWIATDEYIASVAFSDDGDRLTVLTQQGNVSLWHLDEAAWLQRVCTVANRNLTHSEWRTYVGETRPYERTCPDLPAPADESVAPVASA